jgi:hypothetical protein
MGAVASSRPSFGHHVLRVVVVAGRCNLGGLLSRNTSDHCRTPESCSVEDGRVLAQGPSEAELRPLSSALTLIEGNEWCVAETRLTEGLREFPRSAVLSNAMRVVYEQEDRPAEAIRAYEQAIEWLLASRPPSSTWLPFTPEPASAMERLRVDVGKRHRVPDAAKHLRSDDQRQPFGTCVL